MAESIAPAVLENLVHMPRQDFPIGYVVVAALLPPDVQVYTEASVSALAGIRQGACRELGDYWFDRSLSAVLRVSSVVVPSEHNFLLNPNHTDFRKISVYAAEPFHFDERLFH
jgi:RES domain-containing protein